MKLTYPRHWNAYEYWGPNIHALPPERVIDDWEALESKLLLELYKFNFQSEDDVRFPYVVDKAIAGLLDEGFAVRHEARPDEVDVAALFHKLTFVTVWWVPEERGAGICGGQYPDIDMAEWKFQYVVADLLSECKGERQRMHRVFKGHLHVVDDLGRRRLAPRPVSDFADQFPGAWEFAHSYNESRTN